MIAAHGAHVGVNTSGVEVHYSPLMEALQHSSRTIALSDINGVTLQAPTPVVGGQVLIDGPDFAIAFSPGQHQEAKQLVSAIEAALRGEVPPEISSGIAGFDFVAFDVETANADWGSICQMGAVRYVDGIATESVSWLVTPPPGLDSFDPDNVAIHGITADDVADAPAFPDRLAALIDFVGDLPLVAHNAQFDFTALSRACAASGIEAPTLIFGCTLLMARSAKLGFENNKLPTVAAGLGVELTKHHDATADAAACGDIAVALARRAGYQGAFREFCYSQGFTMGLLEPTRVYPVLRDRSGAGAALQRAKLDGVPVKKKSEPDVGVEKPRRGAAPWARVATPDEFPDPNPDADPAGPLFAQNVTLTGDFAPYDKGDLWRRIADHGATVGKGVTKKTTILVCGPWASKTSKQKRAEELIEKGQDIQIWDEQRLYGALGLDEQPPF